MNNSFVNNILRQPFFSEALALQLFQYQYNNNSVYRQWCDLLHVDAAAVNTLEHIPFLPISFFKTHTVTTNQFAPEVVFTSSGTTQTTNSRHFVKEVDLYKQSFTKAFEMFYGSITNLCIIGLLPSYLERTGSSLVYMVDHLIAASNHPQSGFYLYDFATLNTVLTALEKSKQKTVLIGVTFALLDFAEAYQPHLHHTIVMETGGMKGRKMELTRMEVHNQLKEAFQLPGIHSEYGMTELLSQAYSAGDGIYKCPPWMKVLVRNEEDPLTIYNEGRGVLNIIDLANIDSCSFIASDDAGIIHPDGTFEIIGRLDNSDLRGCSLLTL